MKLKQIKRKNYYECNRCNISSEENSRMCPCPRGSCDAVKKGTVIITKEIKLTKPSYFK